MTNELIATHLKEIRTEKHYTMRALAEAIDTPHSFIAKTEQHGRRLDVGEFIYYCQAMKENPIEVLQTIVHLLVQASTNPDNNQT